MLAALWRLLKVLLVFTTCAIFCKKWSSLACDGASINSGLKGGVAVKFREKEELFWLPFIWCLLHRLELAASDGLHEHLLFVKQCLCKLFCLYEKSWKKLKGFHRTSKNIWVSEQASKTSKIPGHTMDHSYKAWLVLLTSSEFTSDTSFPILESTVTKPS